MEPEFSLELFCKQHSSSKLIQSFGVPKLSYNCSADYIMLRVLHNDKRHDDILKPMN